MKIKISEKPYSYGQLVDAIIKKRGGAKTDEDAIKSLIRELEEVIKRRKRN